MPEPGVTEPICHMGMARASASAWKSAALASGTAINSPPLVWGS